MVTELDFHGWKAFSLKTEDVELVIPQSIGPRVVSASLKGGANLFYADPESLGRAGEPEWQLRGGHRLWHAPEHPERTYVLDNEPIEVRATSDGKGLIARGNREGPTGITKEIRIEVIDATTFRVRHALKYDGLWPIEVAPWALSVMQRGGFATIPLRPLGEHPRDLLPSYQIIPWDYTDFSHPVWHFGKGYIGVDSAKGSNPQKLGIAGEPGWLGYWQEAGTFVTSFEVDDLVEYPDLNSAREVFCNDFMLELETLGPAEVLGEHDSVEHVEHWGFFADLPKPDNPSAWETFAGKVESWRNQLPV